MSDSRLIEVLLKYYHLLRDLVQQSQSLTAKLNALLSILLMIFGSLLVILLLVVWKLASPFLIRLWSQL